MGAPDSPVLAAPGARMADRSSQVAGRPVAPRIGPDAAGSSGPAPTSDGRMAVMGADRTPICDRIADGRHPGPAVEVAFLPDVHNKQAVCPTSSLTIRARVSPITGLIPTRATDCPASTLDRADSGRRTRATGSRWARGRRTHPHPRGGQASGRRGAPAVIYPPTPPISPISSFPPPGGSARPVPTPPGSWVRPPLGPVRFSHSPLSR